MSNWPRRFTLVVAILSIALAACFVPPVAHSAMHAGNTEHSQAQGDHQHAGPGDCHEQNDSSAPHDKADNSQQCCAAACGASAFLRNVPQLSDPLRREHPAIAVPDMLDAADWLLIDPPPRAA